MINNNDFSGEIYHLKRENNALRQHALTFSCLGKLRATNHTDLYKWKKSLNRLLRKTLAIKEISSYPLIIGLAESGIVPSALIHFMLRKKKIYADWICSTRRESEGIIFTETHSHAPDHILPIPCYQPTELWFVEDEMTTGKTVLCLALKLCRMMNVRQVRFLSIADMRSPVHKDQFQSVMNDYDIDYSFQTLLRLKPNNGKENQSNLLTGNKSRIKKKRLRVSDNLLNNKWHFPHQRPALKNQRDVCLSFSKKLEGTLLVIGEAIDIGLKLVHENPKLSFQHITLSPWEIDGKHIINRLDICGKYYLYNYHHLKTPIYLLYDPIDAHIGTEVERLLFEKGYYVERLNIV